MKIHNGHCSQSGRLNNWGSRLWEWFRKILVEGLPVLVWKDTFFISSTCLTWRMMPSNLDVPFFGWVSKDLPWPWIKSQTFNHLESGTMSIISFAKHKFLICKTRILLYAFSSAHPSCYNDCKGMKRLYKYMFVCISSTVCCY